MKLGGLNQIDKSDVLLFHALDYLSPLLVEHFYLRKADSFLILLFPFEFGGSLPRNLQFHISGVSEQPLGKEIDGKARLFEIENSKSFGDDSSNLLRLKIIHYSE